MSMKERAIKELKDMNLRDNKYLQVDVIDFAYNNMEIGNEVKFDFITEESYETVTGEIDEKRIQNIEGEEEKCFVVKKGEDRFLVPLSEIREEVNKFAYNHIEDICKIEKYIEENLKQFEYLENFDFLTDVKFGLEIEGGWNGSLSLDRFSCTVDNSFDVPDKDRNDEFVYRGCDNARTMLENLFSNYPALSNHSFSYNKNCGTHIHFSEYGQKSNTFDKINFLKTVSFLISIEDILLDIIPDYRVATIDKLTGDVFSKEGGYSKTIYHRENKVLNTIEEIKYRLRNKEITNNNVQRIINKLEKTWYGKHYASKGDKYNITRYYGINLHTYFYRGSLELRYFEGNYRNAIYYVDLVDKIMNLIQNFDWETISMLLERLDSYKKISTKTNALLYAIGVNNETLNKLLSRTDYSQLNIVMNHTLLNDIRSKITDEEVELDIPDNYKQQNIEDTTNYPNELDSNVDYTKRKNSVLDKIIEKKGTLKKGDFGRMLGEYKGQNKEDFVEYINEVSENLEEEGVSL